MYGIGDATNTLQGLPAGMAHQSPEFGSNAWAFNVAGHALVGCGQAMASGDKCGPGALAGAVTSATGPVIKKLDLVGGTIASAVLGGAVAVAGGGKFANGAFTGAFGYLYNQLGRNGSDPNERHQMGVNAAIQDYIDRGYSIVEAGPVAVDVPGFS